MTPRTGGRPAKSPAPVGPSSHSVRRPELLWVSSCAYYPFLPHPARYSARFERHPRTTNFGGCPGPIPRRNANGGAQGPAWRASWCPGRPQWSLHFEYRRAQRRYFGARNFTPISPYFFELPVHFVRLRADDFRPSLRLKPDTHPIRNGNAPGRPPTTGHPTPHPPASTRTFFNSEKCARSH